MNADLDTTNSLAVELSTVANVSNPVISVPDVLSQVDKSESADEPPKQIYKNVYCMPIKPRTKTDDEIFSKRNTHVYGGTGKCPCCD